MESGVRVRARVRVGKADKGWGCESGIGMNALQGVEAKGCE